MFYCSHILIEQADQSDSSSCFKTMYKNIGARIKCMIWVKAFKNGFFKKKKDLVIHLCIEKNYLLVGSTHVNLNYKHLYKNIYFKDFLQQQKIKLGI